MGAEMPSIGRIVHYVDDDGRHNAAIITDTPYERFVSLTVFQRNGFYIGGIVDYSEDHDKHSWHWPERE